MGGIGDNSQNPATGKQIDRDGKTTSGGNPGESDQATNAGTHDAASLFNGLFKNLGIKIGRENPFSVEKTEDRSNTKLLVPTIELSLSR